MRFKRLLAVIVAACLIGCIGTNKNSSDFSDITGKMWLLMDVYIDEADTQFRRDSQPDGLPKDIFTVKFEEGIISGTGAPNLFSAPYSLLENQGISIMPMRSTLMASLFEPENLKEHDFYLYLQNAYRWELSEEKLTLHSKTKEGLEVRLILEKKSVAGTTFS
jgi:heat shock protein HslJ